VDRKENQLKLICVKKIENAPNKNEKFVAVISWKGETENKTTHEAFSSLKTNLSEHIF